MRRRVRGRGGRDVWKLRRPVEREREVHERAGAVRRSSGSVRMRRMALPRRSRMRPVHVAERGSEHVERVPRPRFPFLGESRDFLFPGVRVAVVLLGMEERQHHQCEPRDSGEQSRAVAAQSFAV
jgi:hypothetical protein